MMKGTMARSHIGIKSCYVKYEVNSYHLQLDLHDGAWYTTHGIILVTISQIGGKPIFLSTRDMFGRYHVSLGDMFNIFATQGNVFR